MGCCLNCIIDQECKKLVFYHGINSPSPEAIREKTCPVMHVETAEVHSSVNSGVLRLQLKCKTCGHVDQVELDATCNVLKPCKTDESSYIDF